MTSRRRSAAHSSRGDPQAPDALAQPRQGPELRAAAGDGDPQGVPRARRCARPEGAPWHDAPQRPSTSTASRWRSTTATTNECVCVPGVWRVVRSETVRYGYRYGYGSKSNGHADGSNGQVCTVGTTAVLTPSERGVNTYEHLLETVLIHHVLTVCEQ
jgi:hypothetical protein